MAKRKKEPKSNRGAIMFLERYGVLILILLVAGFQMTQIPKGLSRWRGGGFGMYAELHPNQREVSVVFFEQAKKPFGAFSARLQKRLKTNPNEANFRRLGHEIQEKSGIRAFEVKVWKPSFDPESLIYKRRIFKKWQNKPNRK